MEETAWELMRIPFITTIQGMGDGFQLLHMHQQVSAQGRSRLHLHKALNSGWNS